MNINAELFTEFFSLINMSGEEEIKECIAKGTETELSVYATSPNKTIIVKGVIKGNYSELGEMGVDSVALLRKITSSCSGDLSVTKTTSKLKIASGKKVKADLALRNPQYVLNAVAPDKFDVLETKASGNIFTITKDMLTELSKFYGLIGKELNISGEGNVITFAMETDENSVEVNFDIAETVKKFDVRMSALLMKVLPLIKTTATASINDKATVISIKINNAGYEFTYLVAPMVK